MWLLVLVLVFDPPNWPENQARPMREVQLEYATRAECERDMRDLARDGENRFDDQPTLRDWDVLLESCEPKDALTASSLPAQRG